MDAVAKKKIDPTFGRRLRELREAKGWSQAQLADEAGMLYQNIARIERGESEPVWSTALRLAAALGADVGEFVTSGQAEADRPKRKKK